MKVRTASPAVEPPSATPKALLRALVFFGVAFVALAAVGIVTVVVPELTDEPDRSDEASPSSESAVPD